MAKNFSQQSSSSLDEQVYHPTDLDDKNFIRITQKRYIQREITTIKTPETLNESKNLK